MDVHSPFYKNTAKLLVVVIALNPIAAAAADLAVDASAGGNTAITHAGNGVPVVNIATPTGKGLSHNKFLDYNVNQEGLILNNATAKLQSTQLGGYILGNGNLNGQAARVILNEVTGSNTSLLKGYTEVAGQAAHTIVANPHGISCDGCGFINTPRVTLSTGKPLVAQGQLEGYDVEQGAIAIEGQGLNARNVDQFELITRSAQINAALHAKQLNITTGRNQVDAATLATEAKPQDGSAQPQLAIDSAALGGMYADTIHLVGTEQGVGVKLAGDMAASAGDIHIDTNGELSLARTASSGDTTIKAQQVVLTDNSQAGGRVQISATGASGSVQLAPGKRLASRADMQIDASRIDNQGTLQAGMQANGDANPPAAMRLAGGELINRGTLHALGSLSTQLNALDNSDGTLISSGTAHIAAHYLLNQRGSLLAHDALSLQTQHTDNRAGLLASDRAIDLFASQQLHNGDGGLLLSAAGGLNIEAGHLLNQGGTLQSNNGQLNLSTTGTLDNSAGQILSANAAISLTAADLFNLNGQLQAEGGSITATTQHFFNQQGRVQADSLSLTSQHSLNNSDGTLSASQGDVQLQGPADIINQRGHITAQRQLAIDADRLDNHAGTLGGEYIDLTLSDRLDNTDGLVEAANSLHLNAHSTLNSHGQLRALGSSGESTFNLSALFSNDQGQVDIGNARFSLNSKSLSNQQGTVQHIGTQGFNLNLADVGGAGGSFITHGALTLAVDQWLNTSMLQAQRLDLNVGHFTQSNSGQLLAVEDINASGEHWHNDGRIEAGGALNLNLQGHYRGQGALLSQGDMRLQAASGELQQGAQLRAGGDAELQLSGELSNAGQLSAAGPLALSAGALSNFGILGSARSLHLAASSVLNDGGLLFSGEQMQLHANQLSNRRGNIFSLATLDIAKDDTLAQMDLLDNLSGSIESSGDLQLRAAQLNNRKQSFSQGRALVWGHIAVKCGDCSGDHHNVDYVATERFETRVSEDSPAARIHSGGKLSLQAGEIANRYSSISAVGDIDISAQHLENTGAASGNIERVRVFNTGRVTDGTDWRFRSAYIRPYNASPAPKELSSAFSGLGLTQDIETLTPTGLQAPALIQAGGAITIQASQTSSNSVLIDRQAPLAGNPQSLDSRAALTQPPLVVQLNPQRQADLQQQAINPLSLPDFALPDGDNGLFHINSDPGHPYLVETNPLFASLHGFLNSDYLLDQIGYHSDQTRRRLGDGLYEQRLIEQAIIARTGQRFLAGMNSDEAQFKQLMDNAIASKTALNLAPGIALSAEQVAALTHDIVWMQEQEVNGQKVLVPVLYLAQAKDRLAPSGALIAGRDINLISGSQLHNSGTLRAQRELQLSAGNVQNTGLIQADQRLNLLAADSLHNSHGGLITARQVSATTLTGDIRNERSISQQTRSGKHFSQTTSVIDQAAGIEASETLSLSAGRDILNTGGHINAGGSADLQAGRDLQISAAQAENGRMRQDKRHFWSNSSTTQYGSDVHIGGDLRALARQNLTISASTLKSGGNTTLAATQNVAITSAANTSSQEFRYKGSRKKIHQQDSSVRQQAAQIDAGGKLDIGAGENLLLSASQLKAGQEAYLYAGNDVSLSTAEDSDFHYAYSSKRGRSGFSSTQKTRMDSALSTTQSAALISADSVRLEAANDIDITGSDIASTHDTRLLAGRDIHIAGATESLDTQHLLSSKKSGLMSSGGIGLTLGSQANKTSQSSHSEQTRSSTIGSIQGNVEIVADKHLSLRASDLISGNNILLSGQHVDVLASLNKQRDEQRFTSNSSGLTLALSGTVGSAIDSAYQTARQARREEDTRLSTLQALKASLSGVQAWQASQQNGGMSASNASQFVGISISLGSQKSNSRQLHEQSISHGSTLNAANDIRIQTKAGNNAASGGDIEIQGSQLKAGNTLMLNAERDLLLKAAANTQKIEGKNSSSGGALGVSLGIGGTEAGLSVFASGNSSSGREKGNGTTWTETTLNAGNSIQLQSGRDSVLQGAQISSEQIRAQVGRNLSLQSLQDSDNYSAKQSNSSAGLSVAIIGAGGSANFSHSQSKLNSNYKSVQEQTGFFAGKQGFQIAVGQHTQLDGSVIDSTATPDQNSLSTGTLGWTDIHNKADYSSSQQGIALSGGNSGSGNFTSNMPAGMLTAYNHSDSDSGTTRSALAKANLTIRDTSHQQQDVTTLSRNTEQTNGSIEAIFDKEKEQRRLQQVQLIGEIGTQSIDIIRTQGQLHADKAAREALAKQGNTDPTPEQVQNSPTYKKLMAEYGTGSDLQRAAQAVTAALQGIAGGDLSSALAGASAPYLAQLIKQQAGDNESARLMAHAVLGAVVADAQGNKAAAGAAGAISGELMASLIAKQLYAGKKPEELSEEQKQTVAALATLAAGLAGATLGDDSADAVAAAQAGRNAVENNFLGPESEVQRDLLSAKQLLNRNTIERSKQLLMLEGADQLSDELLLRYRQDPTSMSTKDFQDLMAYLQVFTAEQYRIHGPAKAELALKALLYGPLPAIDSYPFAGSAQAKEAYNKAHGYGGFNPHEKTDSELAYQDALNNSRIYAHLRGLADLGDPASFMLSGTLGATIRGLAATQGAAQLGMGAHQALDGDYLGAGGNILLGVLNVAAIYTPGAKFPILKGFPDSQSASTARNPNASSSITDAEAGIPYNRPVGASDVVADKATTGSSTNVTNHIETKFGPHDIGPLGNPNDLRAPASTFRSGSYTEKVAETDMYFYRDYGGKAKVDGRYWTPEPSTGPLQSQLDSAVLPEWGNTFKNRAVIKVPAGTKYYEGAAASQIGTVGARPFLQGGGIQIFLPNPKLEWITTQ